MYKCSKQKDHYTSHTEKYSIIQGQPWLSNTMLKESTYKVQLAINSH